jgi:hypothetical protein
MLKSNLMRLFSKKNGSAAALFLMSPLLVAAQTQADIDALTADGSPLAPVAKLLIAVGKVVNLLIPIVLSIALLSFFWGMAKFIGNAGSEEARTKGKRLMISSIIALTVMVSIWGIVGFIQESLAIGGARNIAIPQGAIPASPAPTE